MVVRGSGQVVEEGDRNRVKKNKGGKKKIKNIFKLLKIV